MTIAYLFCMSVWTLSVRTLSAQTCLYQAEIVWQKCCALHEGLMSSRCHGKAGTHTGSADEWRRSERFMLRLK